MKDQEISRYIDLLNHNNFSENIFKKIISEKVDLAKVWANEPRMTDPIDTQARSYDFFFIKNELGIYVGAVLDMHIDLHWYICPEHRKKGHLTSALKHAILPYIFYEKEEIVITISKENGEDISNDSRKVAQSVGFKPSGEKSDTLYLSKSDFDWSHERLDEEQSGLDPERVKTLLERISYASKLLNKVNDELEIAYGGVPEMIEITEILTSCNLTSCIWKIDNLEYEYGPKTHNG